MASMVALVPGYCKGQHIEGQEGGGRRGKLTVRSEVVIVTENLPSDKLNKTEDGHC